MRTSATLPSTQIALAEPASLPFALAQSLASLVSRRHESLFCAQMEGWPSALDDTEEIMQVCEWLFGDLHNALFVLACWPCRGNWKLVF